MTDSLFYIIIIMMLIIILILLKVIQYIKSVKSVQSIQPIANPTETFDQPIAEETSVKEHGYVHKPDIMIDPSFSDVKIYNNDENPYADGQQNGMQKCIKECTGNCVEFGVTGIGFCFPETRVNNRQYILPASPDKI